MRHVGDTGHPESAPQYFSPFMTQHHEEEAIDKAYDAHLMRRLLRYLSPYKLQVLSSMVDHRRCFPAASEQPLPHEGWHR